MPSGRRSLYAVSNMSAQIKRSERTLDVSDALVQDLLEGARVLQLLLNLGDDRLGKLALLPLLDLALVADPRIENSLGLERNGGLLLELESLSLELGSLL
jgi:hypothetical protein